MHDEKVDRTTNGRGSVFGMTLSHLQTLNAGYWFSSQFRGEQVPKFEDAIDLLASSDAIPLVELKDSYHSARSAAPTVIKTLMDFKIADRAVVIARDKKQLECVKELSPWTATATVTFSRREAELATGGHNDGLVAFWPSLSPSLIRQAHGSGEFIAAWTVLPRHVLTVARQGVNALITDDPRRGLAIVRGRQ